MSIQISGGGKPPYPHAPRTAELNQTTVAINTAYTVLNVSGKGVVHRITGFLGGGIANNNLTITITLDGVAYSWTPGSYYNSARGIGSISSSQGPSYDAADFLNKVKFNTSLSVTISTSTSTSVINCTVDYSLF